MNNSWTNLTVGDLVKRGEAEIKTGPFGTQLHASDYVDEGIPVINARNLGFGDMRIEKLEFISEETVGRLSTHLLEPGDIVFGRKGTVERHAFIREDHGGWFQGTDCLRLRLKSRSILPRFVSYAFLTDFHKRWIMNQSSHGATMTSLNQDIVSRIPLRIPPFEVQNKIVDILSAYDDLIENNTRRITILEEMARTIYREWFVHFHFPGQESVRRISSPLGPIPEGWEIQLVKDVIARQAPGRIYRETDVTSEGTVPVVDQSTAEILGFHDNEPDQPATPDNPIAIFGDHTCKMQLLVEPFSVGPNVVVFAAKIDRPSAYIFHMVRSLVQTQEYKRHWTSLNAKEVIVADRATAQRFAELLRPSLQQVEALRHANGILRRTRDLLLPKLISGEIECDGYRNTSLERRLD